MPVPLNLGLEPHRRFPGRPFERPEFGWELGVEVPDEGGAPCGSRVLPLEAPEAPPSGRCPAFP